MSKRYRSQLQGTLSHEPYLDKFNVKIERRETNYNLLNKIGNYELIIIMINTCIINRNFDEDFM